MVKKMLLLGATGGLGQCLLEHFKGDYQITSTGYRHSADEQFDFNESQKLLEFCEKHQDADVIINTVGLISDNFEESMMVNYITPASLSLYFYHKKGDRQIVNIGSTASYAGGRCFEYMKNKYIYYSLAKKNLKDFHNSLVSSQQNPKCRMLLVEPEYIDTQMNGGNKELEPSLKLLRPEDIATTIAWALDQPPDSYISHFHMRNTRRGPIEH